VGGLNFDAVEVVGHRRLVESAIKGLARARPMPPQSKPTRLASGGLIRRAYTEPPGTGKPHETCHALPTTASTVGLPSLPQLRDQRPRRPLSSTLPVLHPLQGLLQVFAKLPLGRAYPHAATRPGGDKHAYRHRPPKGNSRGYLPCGGEIGLTNVRFPLQCVLGSSSRAARYVALRPAGRGGATLLV
jgi:hypothetical protein